MTFARTMIVGWLLVACLAAVRPVSAKPEMGSDTDIRFVSVDLENSLLQINGVNFGATEHLVAIARPDGSVLDLLSVISWSNFAITAVLPTNLQGNYRLVVLRTPATGSNPIPGESDVFELTIGGDITEVVAGSGLNGGGNAGDVTVSVDSSQVQSRVSGSCPIGESIRVIGADGSVACEVDDVAVGGGVVAVTASAPLTSSGGSMPNVSLPDAIITGPRTAVGRGALVNQEDRVIGDGNVAVGTDALRNNVIGDGNVAVGNSALNELTRGHQNTAVGGRIAD